MPLQVRLPSRYKTISVFCRCGEFLVKYKKGGKGRLRKIHPDRIKEDCFGIFDDRESPAGTDILCPNCQERIATIQIVSGKYVNKINQGQLGIIKKS